MRRPMFKIACIITLCVLAVLGWLLWLVWTDCKRKAKERP